MRPLEKYLPTNLMEPFAPIEMDTIDIQKNGHGIIVLSLIDLSLGSWDILREVPNIDGLFWLGNFGCLSAGERGGGSKMAIFSCLYNAHCACQSNSISIKFCYLQNI